MALVGLVVSGLVAAAFLASVPVAGAIGVLTLPHLLVVAVGNGACTGFFRAAYPALVRSVAPSHQQEVAFSRLFGTEAAMQVAGAGLGGIIAQLMTAAWGLALDSVSFLVSALCLWRLRLPSTSGADDPASSDEAGHGAQALCPASGEESLRTRIREGITLIRGDRVLSFFTVLGGVSNFGLTGYGALLVLFMVSELRLGSGGVGVVMALGSVGGFLGATIAPRLSARFGSARSLLWLQVLAGPTALLVPLATPGAGAAYIVAGVLLVGIGVVGGNVIRGAWRNRYVPPGLLARQVTTTQVVNFGTTPLAGPAAGWLGTAIGLRPTIAIMAGVHALACLSMFWSPIRGLREMPDQPGDTDQRPVRGEVNDPVAVSHEDPGQQAAAERPVDQRSGR